MTDLEFSFAIAGDGTGWDPGIDESRVERSIGGGSFSTLFLITNMGVLAADAPNVFQFGFLDQGQLNSTFTTYSSPILLTGSDLDIIIRFRINSGVGEDFAMDNIALTATIPIPAAVWLFGSAVGLLVWLRRSGNISPAQCRGQALAGRARLSEIQLHRVRHLARYNTENRAS